jgi:hypothetical protein
MSPRTQFLTHHVKTYAGVQERARVEGYLQMATAHPGLNHVASVGLEFGLPHNLTARLTFNEYAVAGGSVTTSPVSGITPEQRARVRIRGKEDVVTDSPAADVCNHGA